MSKNRGQAPSTASADIAARGIRTGLVAMISEGWRRSTEAGSGDLLAIDPEVTSVVDVARFPLLAEWDYQVQRSQV